MFIGFFLSCCIQVVTSNPVSKMEDVTVPVPAVSLPAYELQALPPQARTFSSLAFLFKKFTFFSSSEAATEDGAASEDGDGVDEEEAKSLGLDVDSMSPEAVRLALTNLASLGLCITAGCGNDRPRDGVGGNKKTGMSTSTMSMSMGANFEVGTSGPSSSPGSASGLQDLLVDRVKSIAKKVGDLTNGLSDASNRKALKDLLQRTAAAIRKAQKADKRREPGSQQSSSAVLDTMRSAAEKGCTLGCSPHSSKCRFTCPDGELTKNNNAGDNLRLLDFINSLSGASPFGSRYGGQNRQGYGGSGDMDSGRQREDYGKDPPKYDSQFPPNYGGQSPLSYSRGPDQDFSSGNPYPKNGDSYTSAGRPSGGYSSGDSGGGGGGGMYGRNDDDYRAGVRPAGNGGGSYSPAAGPNSPAAGPSGGKLSFTSFSGSFGGSFSVSSTTLS